MSVEPQGPPNKLEQLREKKEPRLGDFNPLLFGPDFSNPDAVEALKIVAQRRIDQYSGVHPDSLEVVSVYNGNTGKTEPRLVVRFSLDKLGPHQLDLLEQQVSRAYPRAIRARKDTDGKIVAPDGYPELSDSKLRAKNVPIPGRLLGWYMGTDPSRTSNVHTGLFVYRDLGSSDMANFLRGRDYKQWFFHTDIKDPITYKPIDRKYLVEIREAALYQTDLVELIVQTASILGRGEVIGNNELKYQIYNDLNRLGLRGVDGAIYGLDNQISAVERALILPLANLGLSAGIGLRAASVLLAGYPGTGKTLIARHFLQADTGVFIVPLDPLALARDLTADPHKKTILPRVSQVAEQTGIPVVLHVDDIENIVADKEVGTVNSTLLNLMAGVRESGFFLLASTNYPERLNPQLLQPERFARILYCSLPSQEARQGVLRIHATKVSRELGIPLFTSDEQREAVLESIAVLTEYYTPRFLAEICTTAKGLYLQRVASAHPRRVGLTEAHISETFSLDDWAKAVEEVNRKFDKEAVRKRDEEIRKFIERHSEPVGFGPSSDGRATEALRSAVQRAMVRYPKTGSDLNV